MSVPNEQQENAVNDILDVEPIDNERAQSLKTVGWISYVLHLIVAVAAVVPGAQVGAGLLIVALIIDLVKNLMPKGLGKPAIFPGVSAL